MELYALMDRWSDYVFNKPFKSLPWVYCKIIAEALCQSSSHFTIQIIITHSAIPTPELPPPTNSIIYAPTITDYVCILWTLSFNGLSVKVIEFTPCCLDQSQFIKAIATSYSYSYQEFFYYEFMAINL